MSVGYLRVAVVSHNSNFILKRTFNNTLEIIGGYESQFLDMITKGLRLQPIVYISDGDEWGRIMEDGNWTGLIGMAQRGDVDMSISALHITQERMKAVDYSYPYSIEDVTFATRKPGTVPTAMALVKPFSPNIWIALLVSLAVFSLIFYLLMSKKNSIHKTLLILLGYVLNQPSNAPSRRLTDRFLIGAWMCGTLFLSKIYSCFLLSFLTLPIKEDGIKNINQLSNAVAAGTYKCYTTEGSSLLEGLSSSEHEDTKIITMAIKKNNWLLRSEEHQFEKYVQKKNTAIIRTRQYLYNIFQDDVFISDDSFYSAYAGIVLPKKSLLKRKINFLIQRIASSGIYQKSVEYHLFQKNLIKNSRRKTKSQDLDKINLEDLKGAILVLTSGYLVSSVVCLIEILYNIILKKAGRTGNGLCKSRKNSNTTAESNNPSKRQKYAKCRQIHKPG